jgi:ElaB/YqjD/DUF883 family membrane-anchored ribosome-binding protein
MSTSDSGPIHADQLDRARGTANEYLQQGREKAEELTSSIEGLIRNQPLQAMVVAAGIGFVLGACWMRR